MADENVDRKYGDYFLCTLVILYIIFAIGIIGYGVVLRNKGQKEGLLPMFTAIGIDTQIQLLYASGAFTLFISTCFIIGLCLAPRWGCWFLLGSLFLVLTIAINIYLVCELIVSVIYGWGTKDYLWNLDYTTPEGKELWDSLQTNYECCGVLDEDEWEVKPASCPNFDIDDESIHGCSPKFAAVRRNKTIVLIVVLFLAIVLEILGLVAVYLFLWPYFVAYREGRKEEEEGEEEEGEDEEDEDEDEMSELSEEEPELEVTEGRRG